MHGFMTFNPSMLFDLEPEVGYYAEMRKQTDDKQGMAMKNTATNMTTGNPLRLIVKFMFPLLLGNLFQQLYNIIDAAIVGQTLGAKALGAVGLSTSVQFLVLGFCAGAMTGFAIPCASSFGAHRESRMRRFIYNGILLTIVLAVILTVTTALLTRTILIMLQAPQELFNDAYAYLLVIFLGIPAMLLYNYLGAVLRAIGDSKTPFWTLAFSSALNIALDFYCILVLRWGTAGAAIATVFSQSVSAFLCWIYIRKKVEILCLRKEEKVFDPDLCRILLNMGIPMGLQFSITAIGSMIMQAANNGFGTIYVAGLAAAVKIKIFTMSPFDALAAAVATFIAQNDGAHQIQRLDKGMKIGWCLAIAYGIIIGFVLFFAGRYLTMIFINGTESEVLHVSERYLKALSFFYTILGLLIVTRMAIQGIGWSKRAMAAGIIEMAARTTVSLWLVPLLGFTAICIADQTAWILATIYLIPTWYGAYAQAKQRAKQV